MLFMCDNKNTDGNVLVHILWGNRVHDENH